MASPPRATALHLIGRRVASGLAALAMAGLAAACSDQNPTASNMTGGTTSLTILLKDAPGDLKSAWVTIDEIDLVGTGGTQVLMSTPTTQDLLSLASNTATLIQDVVVPSGTYTELRFKISGGCIAVDQTPQADAIYATDGFDASLCGGPATGRLQMPSYGQSGLKVIMPGDALTITGPTKILLVDFDVSQSFGHQAGQSGMWVMHPVIKGATFGFAGSLLVTLKLGDAVTLPDLNNTPTTLDMFSAVVVSGVSDTVGVVQFSAPDQNGISSAEFGFLAPGDYTLSLAPPTGLTVTTDPVTPETVTVVANQETTADLIITGATTGGGGT